MIVSFKVEQIKAVLVLSHTTPFSRSVSRVLMNKKVENASAALAREKRTRAIIAKGTNEINTNTSIQKETERSKVENDFISFSTDSYF